MKIFVYNFQLRSSNLLSQYKLDFFYIDKFSTDLTHVSKCPVLFPIIPIVKMESLCVQDRLENLAHERRSIFSIETLCKHT